MDPALVQTILAAIPREALGAAVVAGAAIYAMSKVLGPIRQQAIPAKGAINGGSRTLHEKLDNIGDDVRDLRGDVRELREGQTRIVERVESLEEVRQVVLKAHAELGLGPSDVLPADPETRQRKER